MKKGILVYDKKDAEYNEWFIKHIITAGAKHGLDISLLLTEEIKVFTDDKCEADIADTGLLINEVREAASISDIDFAIMRNRNASMSERLEKMRIKCFNSSYVCRIGNDKWEMYRDFAAAGIPVMYTQNSKLPYPFVMKPRDGHGGQNVFLIKNKDEFEEVLKRIKKQKDGQDMDVDSVVSADDRATIDSDRNDATESSGDDATANYIYQFVASERGRDIRVYVVGDTILTAMERTAGNDEFRANFSLGGSAKEHALTEEELKLAAKVQDHIKADFVGIDIIYNNGKPIVNEIEDAVGTRMLYQETDIDAVEEYIKWITNVVALS